MKLRDPVDATEPPRSRRRAVRDPRAGEPEVEVDGVRVPARRQRACSGPASRRTSRRACSRAARVTVERIHRDYDGSVHLGVSVDDDPVRS